MKSSVSENQHEMLIPLPSIPPQIDLFSKFQSSHDLGPVHMAPESDLPETSLLSSDLLARLQEQPSRLQEIRDRDTSSPSKSVRSLSPSRAVDSSATTGGMVGEYVKFQSAPNKQSSESLYGMIFSSPRPRRVPLWSVSQFERAGGYCLTNELVALHQEIMDCVHFLMPTTEELVLRKMVELEVSHIAHSLWSDCEPMIYGSMMTQLLLPTSDMDLSLLNVSVGPEVALPLLATEIAQLGCCTNAFPQVILKTKVPLVKFNHSPSQIGVDISINTPDGKINSNCVVKLLKEYPEAHYLIYIIKYMLHQRDMHEPYHGGLGSFTTTLLVVHFLQNHPIYNDFTHERDAIGLGKLLVDFFRYYGICFKPDRCGISVSKENRAFRRHFENEALKGITSPKTGQPCQLIVEDPSNSSNNTAASVRQFQAIQVTFRNAYYLLTANYPPYLSKEGSPASSRISERPTLLSRILHVDAGLVAHRQEMLKAYHMLDTQTTPSIWFQKAKESFPPSHKISLNTDQSQLKKQRSPSMSFSSPDNAKHTEGDNQNLEKHNKKRRHME